MFVVLFGGKRKNGKRLHRYFLRAKTELDIRNYVCQLLYTTI